MKVKTTQNNENNRGRQSKKDLKKEIISTWLGRPHAKITLGMDGTECDVQEIRDLLHEEESVQSQASEQC